MPFILILHIEHGIPAVRSVEIPVHYVPVYDEREPASGGQAIHREHTCGKEPEILDDMLHRAHIIRAATYQIPFLVLDIIYQTDQRRPGAEADRIYHIMRRQLLVLLDAMIRNYPRQFPLRHAPFRAGIEHIFKHPLELHSGGSPVHDGLDMKHIVKELVVLG